MPVIYALIDPTSLDIRYIGYTSCNPPELRLQAHIKDALSGGNYHNHRWIRKLHQDGLVPEFGIVEEVNEFNWSDREQFWIKTLRELGYNLTNMSDGGDGNRPFMRRARKEWSKTGDGKAHNR